ncbi:hypothetical protein VTL71DRAFT_12478 [Oculimacula yallundae]|uniref:Tr-type G domain-containing protein n=1 Tax=Oculimacula yallundae TaxID=86028 RepID=A0ABR4CPH8_9HELO
MSPPSKTLLFLGPAGAGKATALGCLLFKYGGIDMLTMERFQRDGIKSNDQAARDLKSRGLERGFYIPNSHVLISDGSSKVNCVILVIPAASGSVEFKKEFDTAAVYSKKIIVLVNKMDVAGWSEDSFRTTVKSLGADAENFPIIPFSALEGDNAVEKSLNNSWYEGPTLLEALQASFDSTT